MDETRSKANSSSTRARLTDFVGKSALPFVLGDFEIGRGNIARYGEVGDFDDDGGCAFVDDADIARHLGGAEFLEARAADVQATKKDTEKFSIRVEPEAACFFRIEFAFGAFVAAENANGINTVDGFAFHAPVGLNVGVQGGDGLHDMHDNAKKLFIRAFAAKIASIPVLRARETTLANGRFAAPFGRTFPGIYVPSLLYFSVMCSCLEGGTEHVRCAFAGGGEADEAAALEIVARGVKGFDAAGPDGFEGQRNARDNLNGDTIL